MPSPITNATLQAAALSTVSNLCAQLIAAYQSTETDPQKAVYFDVWQLIRFILLTLMTAPPNYHWQQFLERTFPAYPTTHADHKKDDNELKAMEAGQAQPVTPGQSSAQPKFSLKNTLTKWFVDCITAGAVMNTVAFLVLMGLMKAQPLSQIMDNIRNETIPIIVAGYKIWPIASIISFSFIPVHRRIVFLSFVGLLWGIYMSMVAARV